MRRFDRGFFVLTLLAPLALVPASGAPAQDVCVPSPGAPCDDPPTYEPTNEIFLALSDDLSGRTFPDRQSFLDALREATTLAIDAPSSERVQFVAAILDPDTGEIVEYDVSSTFLMVPGQPELVVQGKGPTDSPWDGYETPAFGFEASVYGYETPAFGYETPAFGYDGDEAAGFDTPGAALTDPVVGIEAIWGSSGVLLPLPEEGPGEKAFVFLLFSMSVGRDAGDATAVGHSSTMVSFRMYGDLDGES